MATKKKKPEELKPTGPKRETVLSDQELKKVLINLGEMPEDAEGQMVYLALRTQIFVMNRGTRESAQMAEKILKLNKDRISTLGKTGAAATAEVPPARREEQ